MATEITQAQLEDGFGHLCDMLSACDCNNTVDQLTYFEVARVVLQLVGDFLERVATNQLKLMSCASLLPS